MDALSALKFTGGQNPADKLASSLTDIKPKGIPLEDLAKLTPGSQDVSSSSPTSLLSGISGSSGGGSFENLLSNFVGEVNAKQSAAGDALTGLMSGKNVSLHQAMISMEEASVSFQMMVEVRNKVLDSYQELMRMSV